MGTIVEEYDKGIGEHIIVCNFVDFGTNMHLNKAQCGVALQHDVSAVGSHNGKGHG